MARTYTQERYRRDLFIVKSIERAGLNLANPYADIEGKIGFLESLGIMNLRISSNQTRGPFSPIRECSHARVSQTAKTYYEDARRRIDEYQRGERVIPGIVEEDNFEEEIRRPRLTQLRLF